MFRLIRDDVASLTRDFLKHLLPAPLFWRFLTWRADNLSPKARLLRYLCDKSKVSIDVGASVGSYTIHLLTHSRKCYAFEPRPATATRLLQRLTSRAHPRLRLEIVALSDATGESELITLKGRGGMSTIEKANRLERYGPVEISKVPTRRLDDYDDIEPVGCIKITAEGHEDAVLRGAKRILLRDHPSLVIQIEERHKPYSISTVNSFLDELGYKGFLLNQDRLNSIQSINFQELQDIPNVYYDRTFTYMNTFVFVSHDYLAKIQHLIK